jgi:hypothetical protein
MISALDRGFFDLVTQCDRIFWGGTMSPLGRLTICADIYDAHKDFRVAPDLHRSFPLVMLVERDLATVKAWPIVVDEALRLLAPGGTLLLRYSQSALLTSFALKHQLMAWTRGAIEPVTETIYADNLAQSAFRLTGPSRPAPSLTSYSFCMITDGNRHAEVDRFIASIRALEGLDEIEYEILVCAPAAECARLVGQPQLRAIQQDQGFETKGWITRKKNQLVEAARFENLVVAHDRYRLPADFLTMVTAFGADFDVLVCAQQLPNGERFPDWVTLGSAWCWTASAMLDYDDYTPHQYINGGIMLAKREVVRETPWNELLFWQQAEDVELTRRLQQRGRVPRLARHVVAVTAHAIPEYLASFEILPRIADAYPLTGVEREHGTILLPPYLIDTQVALTGPSGPPWQQGLRLSESWELGADSAKWNGSGRADISFRLDHTPQTELKLTLGLRQPSGPFILEASGRPVDIRTDVEGNLRAIIPLSAVLPRNLIRLSLRSTPRTWLPLEVTFLQLSEMWDRYVVQPDTPMSFAAGQIGAASLRAGWSNPESWGVWSVGEQSSVSLLLAYTPVEDIRLEIDAEAFTGARGKRLVGVSVGGIPIGCASFAGDGAITRHGFVVPLDLVGAERELRLAFHLQDAGSPLLQGISGDSRHLGIGLHSLSLRPT